MKWRATASFVGHRHRLVVGRRVVRRVVDSREERRQDRLALLGGERLREAVRDPKLAARLAVGLRGERHELGGAPPLLRAKVAVPTRERVPAAAAGARGVRIAQICVAFCAQNSAWRGFAHPLMPPCRLTSMSTRW